LAIKGEKKTEEEERDDHYHCVERYSGFYQRVFQLPSGVKVDQIMLKMLLTTRKNLFSLFIYFFRWRLIR
jgi:hypothetical protein